MKILLILLCQLSSPNNITTKDIGMGRVEFNWTRDECAEEYIIRYKKIDTIIWNQVTVKDIPYVFTLPSYDVYVYQIASSNSKGISEWSNFNTIPYLK
jgi:hypothetical protein